MSTYRFEMYNQGKCILKTDDMSFEKAQKFFIANYTTNYALRLFVNNERIPYLETARTLHLTKSQCLDIFIPSLRNVKGVNDVV